MKKNYVYNGWISDQFLAGSITFNIIVKPLTQMMIFTIIITRSEEGIYAMQQNSNFINLKIYKSEDQINNLSVVLSLNLLLIGIALFDIN
jgi:hypothetical protein